MTSQNAASSWSTGCGSKYSSSTRRHSNDTWSTGRRTPHVEHVPFEQAANGWCRRSCLSTPPPLQLTDSAMSSVRADNVRGRSSKSSVINKLLLTCVVGLCFIVKWLELDGNTCVLPDSHSLRSLFSVDGRSLRCALCCRVCGLSRASGVSNYRMLMSCDRLLSSRARARVCVRGGWFLLQLYPRPRVTMTGSNCL